MKKAKKLIALCLAMILTIAAGVPVSAFVPAAARIINVHNVQGNDVTLQRGPGGLAVTPRSGQHLSGGNILNTGRLSFVYMQMDELSIVKMDESSRLQVTLVGSTLSLSVQQGAALVEIEQQVPGRATEVLIGPTSFGVHGTSFIIGRRPHEPESSVFITMLSGDGAMRIPGVEHEVPVRAGTMLTVFDEPGVVHRPHGFDINVMGLFELVEVYDRRDMLLDAGFITPQQVVQIPAAITQREIERAARWAAEDARAGILPTPTPTPHPTPQLIRTQFRTNATVQMIGSPGFGASVMGTVPAGEAVWVYGDGQLPQPPNWVWASWERPNQAAVRGYLHSSYLVPLHAPLLADIPSVRPPIPSMTWPAGASLTSALTGTHVSNAIQNHHGTMVLAVRIVAENILNNAPIWQASTQTMMVSGLNMAGQTVVMELTTGSPSAIISIGQQSRTVDIATEMNRLLTVAGESGNLVAGSVQPEMIGGHMYLPMRFVLQTFEIPFRWDTPTQSLIIG